MDIIDSIALSPDAVTDNELENLFLESSQLNCECKHTFDRKGRYCSLPLHGSEKNRDGIACEEPAVWMLVLSGTCQCGKPIISRPYYLCDSCAGVWSNLAVHSEKL